MMSSFRTDQAPTSSNRKADSLMRQSVIQILIAHDTHPELS
jgi:hypothetical protein